jgi:hypothetical protein
MATTVPFVITMEDGTWFDVRVDQRDVAAWEMQDFYDDSRSTVRMRYTAFNAASRTGKTSLSWPKFNATCISVRFDDTEEETQIDVPPTRPAQSDEA